MEKITKNFEVFTFDELTPEIQQKVIERRHRTDDYPFWDWHEFDYEEFIVELEQEGWNTTNKDIYFSGFWSQGDGACFEGSLDLRQYINHHDLRDKYPLILKHEEEFSIRGGIHKNSYATHYCHERTRYAEIEHEYIEGAHGEEIIGIDNIPKLEAEIKALQEDIEDSRLTHSQTLYRTLEKTYEHLTSDETIREEIINNEDRFLSDGSIFN